MIQRAAQLFSLALLLSVASGCVLLKQVFTLNPDGSGKVSFDINAPAGFDIDLGSNGTDESLAAMRRDTVEDILTDSDGVSAWKDVTAEWTDDGRLHIKGTAYFRQLNKVDLDGVPNIDMKSTERKDGALVIRLQDDEKDEEASPAEEKDVRQMSDAELRRHILRERAQYQRSKAVLTAVLTDLKLSATVKLPGKASKVTGVLKKKGDQEVQVRVDGDKLRKQIEQLMARETSWFMRRARETGSLDFMDLEDRTSAMRQMLGGGTEAEAVITQPSGPQFDYKKEVAAARKQYGKMKKRLGLEDVVLPGEKEPEADEEEGIFESPSIGNGDTAVEESDD